MTRILPSRSHRSVVAEEEIIMFIGILLLFLATVAAYHLPHNRIAVRSRQLYQSIQVCSENELTNGNRVVVDTPEGAVVVTKIMDKFFAVNAKCPHLGAYSFRLNILILLLT